MCNDLGGRYFWAFAVNYDSINNKNSIIKLGACIFNVSCQLYITYIVKVFIFKSNLSIKLEDHWFPGICLHKILFSCFYVNNSLLKYVQGF